MAGCQLCARTFATETAALQYMNARSHWACDTCDDWLFDTEEDAEDHMDSTDHWGPKHECQGCYERFHDFAAVRQHMYANNHWRTHFCAPCKSGFESENNLKQASIH